MDIRFFSKKSGWLSCCLLLLALTIPLSMAWGQSFPVPSAIRPNVEFWKRIYAVYPTTKGVIHDSEDLSIVYDVIDLVDSCKHGSRRQNRARVKRAKKKYQHILAALAQGRQPVNAEQRRVAALFGKKASKRRYRRAMGKIRFQLGQRDRFVPGVKRSGQYLARVKAIFRSHGLPEDLAYLPHVESSYNYQAYSKFGAAGMWQFTRSTGRRYMQVDYVVDERRDPIASSHAAAKLLKENYQTLGSWPLAITAYNHGASGMSRAKRKKGSYVRIFSEYRGPHFRFASRNFYPEFIAALHVAKNYQRYFGPLLLARPVQYHTVELKGYAPISEIVNFFRVKGGELQAVNPALRPPVFEEQKYIPKGYKLRLPGKRHKMALMASAMPSSLFRARQKRSRFYRVQRGDTAGKIARRNGVSLADLKIANGLSRRATIYVGQNLRIPGVGEAPTVLAFHKREPPFSLTPTLGAIKQRILAASQKSSLRTVPGPSLAVVTGGAKWREKGNPHGLSPAQEEIVIARQKKVKSTPQVEGKNAGIMVPPPVAPVVVAELLSKPVMADGELVQPILPQPQDTQSLPAADSAGGVVSPLPLVPSHVTDTSPTATSVEDMMRDLLLMPAAENADGAEVAVEQASDESGDTPAVLSAAKAVVAPPDPKVLSGNFSVTEVRPYKKGEMGIIEVEADETLGHYAEWLEIPTQKIRRFNRLRFGRPIHFGQRLKLPFEKIAKEEFEERRFLYHQELREDFFQAYTITGEVAYEVKKGDNLWTLCHEQFDLPFWLLKQYNADFDFRALRRGSVIKVPVVGKASCPSGIPGSDKRSSIGKIVAKSGAPAS